MSKSKRSRNKSSRAFKAGRPRKEGERYPSGKLKPPGPNPRLLEQRAGQGSEVASGGESPLAYALANGLITRRQHNDGVAFAECYRRAGFGGSRTTAGGRAETESTTGHIEGNWSTLPKGRVAEIWDQVAKTVARGQNPEGVAAEALERWKELNKALNELQRAELFRVCVADDWPLWMTTLVVVMAKAAWAGAEVDYVAALGRRNESRLALLSGLDALAALRRPKPPGPSIESVPVARPTGPKAVVETTHYVTATGEPVLTVERIGRVE